jgi:hypothetical protein
MRKSKLQDQAKVTLKSARKALADYKGGPDTPEYQKLNGNVNKAEKALPWYRR